MNKQGKLRLGSFNFIKGVAICIVVFGHFASDFNIEKLTLFYPLFWLLDFLKTPVIPLFFVISGYGFATSRSRTTLKRTVKMLLLPYGFVMLASCILRIIQIYGQTFDWLRVFKNVRAVLIAFMLGIPIPGKVVFGIKLSHCAIVWFLLALFWAHNILNLILKSKNVWVQVVSVVGCAALGYGLFQVGFVYYCIPHGLIATTYFYIGYLLKKYAVLEKELPHKWMYPIWVIIACIYAKWGLFDLCYGIFRNFVIDYVGVIFLTLLLLVIGIRLGTVEWRIFDLVKNAGVYSYWILCIHSIEEKCLPWKDYVQLTQEYPNLGFFFALIIKCALISIGCILLKKIQRWKYRRQVKNYVR